MAVLAYFKDSYILTILQPLGNLKHLLEWYQGRRNPSRRETNNIHALRVGPADVVTKLGCNVSRLDPWRYEGGGDVAVDAHHPIKRKDIHMFESSPD